MFSFTLVNKEDVDNMPTLCQTPRYLKDGKKMKVWKDFIKNDIEKFEVSKVYGEL